MTSMRFSACHLSPSRLGMFDSVHLFWLVVGTISIEEIARLPMPLVWTLYDQWAFCRTEHYTSPSLPVEIARSDERFAVSYSLASRPDHET